MRAIPLCSALAFVVCGALPSRVQETVLYSADFATLGDWTVIPNSGGPLNLWAADATPASHIYGPYLSPPASLNFNDGVDIGGGGVTNFGRVKSGPIDLSLATGFPRLRFWASWNCETDCVWDVLSLKVLSAGSGAVLYSKACLNGSWPGDWRQFDIPLDRAWGSVQVEFGFDTVDGMANDGSGPFIDDLEVVDEGGIFCLGDGSEGDCPCGNQSTPAEGAGCLHSQGGAGRLRATGQASLSADTVVLHGSGMPNQPVLYFQAGSSHAAIPFGDGLLCTGGPFVRLSIEVNASGASAYPSAGDPQLSVRSMIGAPGVRYYQARYRDPASFCTADNFNFTNALTIVWGL